MSDAQTALTIAAALGCGLVAGIFYAFSTFVMPALAARPEPEAAAAMQSINVKAIGAGLLGALFGTAILCLITLVVGIAELGDPHGPYLVAGSVLYLLGAIVVTMAFNVPLNNALADQDPQSEAGREVWLHYLRTWTAWNHVRALTPIVGAALLIVALVQ